MVQKEKTNPHRNLGVNLLMKRDMKPEVTFLFPVHNEAETIKTVISEFYSEVGSKIPSKILVVEDGSIDGTKEVLEKLGEEIPMTLIMGNRRRGYSKAIIKGLKNVNTKYVFLTDSDGQHFAKDFWALYQYKDKYDILDGWRVKRADALHRKIMSKIFQIMVKLLFKMPSLRDITAPYRLMRSDVAKSIANECKFMDESFWTELTIRAHEKGYTIKEIPISHRTRIGEGSTRVYFPAKIPKIVIAHLAGLSKLWLELKRCGSGIKH